MMDTFIKAEQDEMLKALTQICKDNSEKITKELSDKYIPKSSKKYKVLEEVAARVNELLQENARLSKGFQEGCERLERSDRENEQLAEGLSSLEKELERRKVKDVRCDEVERENWGLRREKKKLEKELKERRTVDGTNSPRTSSAKELVSSGVLMEAKINGEGGSVGSYNTLVSKYNSLLSGYKEQDGARKKLEEMLRQKNAEHNKQEKSLESAITNRDNVIESKKETIRNLRAKLADVQGTGGDADQEVVELVLEGNKLTSKSVEQGDGAVKFEEDGEEEAGTPLVEYGKRLSKSVEPAAESLEVNVPASPPKSSSAMGNRGHRSASSTTSIPAALSPAVSTTLHDADFGRSYISQQLPNLLHEGKFHVEDTQFESLELSSPNTEDEEQLPRLSSHDAAEANGKNGEIPELSETPEVVEVRPVRKRRKRAYQEVEPTPMKKIKVELLSSSPIGIAALKRLDQYDSFDLDEIGDKVDTPKKKRQRMIEFQRLASKLSVESQGSIGNGSQLRSLSINSPLSQQTTSLEQLKSEGQERGSPLQPLDQNQQILPRINPLQQRVRNQQILPRTSKLTTPKPRRLGSDKGVNGISEDGHDGLLLNKSTPDNADPSRLEDLLAKPSPPKRALSPARRQEINHFTGEERPAISALPQNVMRLNTRTPGVPPKSRASEKWLEPSISQEAWTALPKRPSREDSVNGDPRTVHSRASVEIRVSRWSRASKTDTPSVKKPSRAIDVKSKGELRTRLRQTEAIPTLSAHKRRPTRDETCNYEMDPENEPLRIRPYETLKLSDFKINPNYNQGIAFAFNDVVRGRDARRCLQGCSKHECCGKHFRSLALMMRDNKRTDQDEVDQKLLEEFMGDNAFKIPYLSPEGREELILQAMTRDFANNYGRHRHAYERRRSPPGFWDADFPTTQEQQEARREELKREEEEITKRYEEAMRPRGRYIFRDES